MENAADALKMAASVLIFVITLAISVNAFSEVRLASQTVLNYEDREYQQEYVEQANSLNGNYLYEKNGKKIYRIDLEDDSDKSEVILGGITDQERFLMALLYGPSTEDRTYYGKQGITFCDNSLYNVLNKGTFKEYIGIYYQEDINKGTELTDVNKNIKKVITYKKV